jgi:ribosomal protein S24E
MIIGSVENSKDRKPRKIKVYRMNGNLLTKAELRAKLSEVMGDIVANLIVDQNFRSYPEEKSLSGWDMVHLEESLASYFGKASEIVYRMIYFD